MIRRGLERSWISWCDKGRVIDFVEAGRSDERTAEQFDVSAGLQLAGGARREDKWFDGIFVVHTNTDLNPLESRPVLHCGTVEQPISHRQAPVLDMTIFHRRRIFRPWC